MSVTHGADVEGLRTTARQLADGAQELLAVSVRITGRLVGLEWNGPDASRARVEWESEHVQTLLRASAALNTAAWALADEADAQESASTDAAGAAAPGGQRPAAADDLRTRLQFQRDILMQLPDVAKLGQALAVSRDLGANLLKFDELWKSLPANSSVFGQVAGGLLQGAGLGLNVHGVYTGIQEDDAHKVFSNAVPIIAAGGVAMGAITASTAAAITVPAALGGMAGTQINDAMQGTRYGDRVQQRFDAVFDVMGPAGMIMTPAVLAQSGIDVLFGLDRKGQGGD